MQPLQRDGLTHSFDSLDSELSQINQRHDRRQEEVAIEYRSVFALVSRHLVTCQISKVNFSESKTELQQKP